MRHRTRHTITAAFAATVLASTAVLAGCSTPPGPGAGDSTASDFKLPSGPKKGKLSIVTKYGNAKYSPYFNDIVKAYEKANPGVDVSIQNAGDQAYKDKVRVLAAGKKLPDVYFSWPGAFADQFVDAGYATDLSPLLKDTKWGKTFSPAALKTVEKGGKIYGVPITLDAKVWIYNKQAFKKAGLGIPKTFSDLVNSCSALKKAGYQPVAFGNQDGWPAVQYLTQLIPQHVPMKTVLKDYRGAKGGFTDPGYVAALKDFQNVISKCGSKGSNAVSDQTVTANFLDSKDAMYFTESVSFGQLSHSGGAPKNFEKEWGFFRNPTITGAAGDQSVLAGAPDTFMINSQSKHKALAADFLKFMTSKHNGQQLLEQLGWLSPVEGSSDNAKTIPQQHQLAELINHTNTMAVWLDTAAAPDTAQAFLAGAEGLLSGSRSPEQVMKQVRAASSGESDQ
jgi:raffinose/stachyose/melibiose transport system substrate-binding protein